MSTLAKRYQHILLLLIATACLFVTFAYWIQPSYYYSKLDDLEVLEPMIVQNSRNYSKERFPRDESMREKWSKVVPGKIVKTSLVCSKKFEVQDYDSTSRKILKSHARPFFQRNFKPQWTWICQKNNCERQHASSSLKLQSLPTCNMLCGPSKLWPKPTGTITLGNNTVKINNFTLHEISSPSVEVSENIKGAFELFKSDLVTISRGKWEEQQKGSKSKRSVIVNVSVSSDSDPRLRLDTDESYKLTVQASEKSIIVKITAQSFCGARHGLETLSQLVWMDPVLESLVMLKEASIEDSPKFKYRGLLLDTARNFFPVTDILRTIDAMAANKLNTFHWHATDSQSFPLKFKSVPQLATFGANGPRYIYTPEDIRTIVHRARLRGIRVVIEIDAPAHVGRAWSWGPRAGFNDLAYCIEEQPWHIYCGEPPCGQLNPLNPHVYEILEKIFAEIIELTEVDDVFHLGGDEVRLACWQKYIKSDPTELWLQFMESSKKALVRANGGKAPNLTLIWSSRLTVPNHFNRLNSSGFSIQQWGSAKKPESIAIQEFGFRSVVSNVNEWYLDCGFGSWRDESFGHCPPYRSWQLAYNHRPWSNDVSGIEGGAACMWSEQLGPFDLDTRLWPRAAAVAERLWSDPEGGASNEVHWRMDTQRSRMVSRGVAAAPIWPKWCTHNPNRCNL